MNVSDSRASSPASAAQFQANIEAWRERRRETWRLQKRKWRARISGPHPASDPTKAPLLRLVRPAKAYSP
jgi:hypothetical protein